MLQIDVTLSEKYDEEKDEFVLETITLEMEHSLLSLSKWESRFEKPFLDRTEKTSEEVLAYIEYMIISPEDFSPEIIKRLSQPNLDEITNYIEAKRTATWFNEPKQVSPNSQIITSELIYYWMTSYRIPWEAEKWHLNRLFTLIKVFNAQNGEKKKTRPQDLAAQRRALNEQRKKQLGTSG